MTPERKGELGGRDGNGVDASAFEGTRQTQTDEKQDPAKVRVVYVLMAK